MEILSPKIIKRPLKSLAGTMKKLLESKLWLKVLVGLLIGVGLGILLGPDVGVVSPSTSKTIVQWVAFPGNLFLKMIKMIIIPLVFSSIILGIIASGEPDFIKKIGPRIALFILFTTTIAITIGLSTAHFIEPGKYIDSKAFSIDPAIEDGPVNIIPKKNLPEKIVDVLPDNPLESMVSSEMLGVVVFTIFLGVALLFIKNERLKVVTNILEVIQESSMIIVKWAMELAPLAVMGLMTQLAAQTGWATLSGLGMYVLTVVLGLIVMLVVYNLLVMILLKISPKFFMKNMKDVMLLAFSTSSSAAVMPLSMKAAEERFGVKPAISRFIIPVGATVNMDGTALYQSVAVVFLAQVFGIDLSFSSMILIVVLTVGSSIGTPSAPGVGIVILSTILESVGIPGSGIALLLGVDRILDMSRTTVNVTGDMVACNFFNKQLAYLFDRPSPDDGTTV